RLESPRSLVPSGSVGIAGKQTGIYSIDSPGGWNIIGRTPLSLFDPGRKFPFLIEAGMDLKFVPITSAEFEEIARGERGV
ncbi:MAG: carboxyltransferase domain-containing protein, partial [Thermovirga sp.]|nr:carboxyltransferase domain-containing protein [Thermovirga sp.]